MKSYTDLEQSKKLAEILPIGSADHHYVRKVCDYRGNAVDGKWSFPKYGNINSEYANYIVQNFTSYEKISCWSLAALLEVLPFGTELHKQSDGSISYYYVEVYNNKEYFSTKRYDNPVDACYELIIKLHEQNLL